jgi:hypothetical protein
MDDCIFCQIIAGRSPASRFYDRNLAPISGTMLRYRSTIGSGAPGHSMANGRSDYGFVLDGHR